MGRGRHGRGRRLGDIPESSRSRPQSPDFPPPVCPHSAVKVITKVITAPPEAPERAASPGPSQPAAGSLQSVCPAHCSVTPDLVTTPNTKVQVSSFFGSSFLTAPVSCKTYTKQVSMLLSHSLSCLVRAAAAPKPAARAGHTSLLPRELGLALRPAPAGRQKMCRLSAFTFRLENTKLLQNRLRERGRGEGSDFSLQKAITNVHE